MELHYNSLSKELEEQIRRDRIEGTLPSLFCHDDAALRRRPNPHDNASIWRPSFVRDCDKILHCPYYNRYSDKTQVFSLLKNDDV